MTFFFTAKFTELLTGLVAFKTKSVQACMQTLLMYSSVMSLSFLALSQNSPLGVETSVAQRLLRAYPESIASARENSVTMRDGKTFSTDSSCGEDDFDSWLDRATLLDQCRQPYVLGIPPNTPLRNADPGRARYTPFFDAIYGHDAASVLSHCRRIQWTDGSGLMVTAINHVDLHVQHIVRELRTLGPKYATYLSKPGGSFKWRAIAGTERRSAHSYGIAIDINSKASDYWRNKHPPTGGSIPYRNRIPWNIVDVFERHGFIWGGKWYHYDTMHFEFRPELCTPKCSCLAER